MIDWVMVDAVVQNMLFDVWGEINSFDYGGARLGPRKQVESHA